MNRIIATGMASTLALTLIPQQQATAQYQQALPAAVAACYSQPTICAVVGAAAGGWILMRRGRKVLCTWDGCQPVRENQIPRELRNEGDYNVPGSMEIHAAADEEGCRRMEARFQRAGRKVKLVAARRVRNAAKDGGVMQYQCIFEGEGATDDWYNEGNYRRHDRRSQ